MKKMSQKTKKLVSDLQELSTQDWSAFDAGLKRVAEHLDEKTFKSFCLREKAYEEAFYSKPSNEGRYNRSEWVARRAVDTLIKLFPDIGDDIIRESPVDSIRELAISNGLYRDISVLDYAAKNGSGSSQLLAAHYCSIKALRELKTSKSFKIRKVVFQRLGPVECLDEMLDDKIADIRYEGIARAPYGYDKLKELTAEIARGPFSMLVEKISSEYLPMLVANRNIKNSWISRKFEERLSAENRRTK
jgi:hypothetical protein